MDAGVSGLELMEAAGASIAGEIMRRYPTQPTAILCGPGNNGGDGFVVARYLARAGWPIKLGLLGARDALKGDAAANADRWHGEVLPLDLAVLDGCSLVVDGLFGAGLTRPLEGEPAALIECINAKNLTCVAIDVPSGVHGDTGEILGSAPKAGLTVTFFRAKPGHYMMPARSLCGDLVVTDIGTPEQVLYTIKPTLYLNAPKLWQHLLPRTVATDGRFNKYSRGHAVILGGAEMTGAARLAARACRRGGAGLVTIAAPFEAFDVYAAGDPGTLITKANGADGFAAAVADPRRNVVVVGPGAGITSDTRAQTLIALDGERKVVVDADALTVFQDDPQALFDKCSNDTLLTPHEGEFKRVFDVTGDKLARARQAAKISGAVVLLKGPDTVIAHPDGRAVINAHAPATLATAGSGDVLAGIAAGLMAQGMDVFDAAATASWLHGETGAICDSGLVAEDLVEALPEALNNLM
ncbi:MAG: NAD(P)H-hydrate dehydratase [Rhodospirillales bacterium]|nr:NAD(P)H-hydrate dehydratase [Rhodospirillales bacterium]